MQLPITVVYGAAAWKIAAALAALIGLVIVRRVRSRRARSRARVDVAKRMAAVTAPSLARFDGVATVQGVLRGGIASSLAIGERGYHDRAGDVHVAYDNQRVELGAPLRLVHGTIARASRGLPRATPAAIRTAIARDFDAASRVTRVLERATGKRVHVLAQVGDGDAVVVHGRFGKRGGVDRFGVRTWILEPELGESDIVGFAVAPEAVATPLRWHVALALAAVLAGGACAAMFAAGPRVLAAGQASARSPELGAFDSLALAAALPGTRDDALAELARRYPELSDELRGLPRY